ncbi:MAG: SDR family oxidoreductase [Alphaproteobacteria bacterium]|nr:MAG: SDR family oxidoreductase [Alphaproteobacteria bacterium]
MKVAIFGASGPTGKLAVQQALAQGHQVTAFVRNPEKFTQSHPGLTVIKADALIPSTFENYLKGHDVVLSALGIGQSFKDTSLYSESGKNIIEAMRKSRVHKFICLTSGGVEDDDPSFEFVYKLIFRRLLRKPYDNMKKLESYLQSVNDIDWIIVRPSRLTDTPLTGIYRVSPRYAPKGGSKISRTDIAQFMLNQLNSTEWLRKTPTLTY